MTPTRRYLLLGASLLLLGDASARAVDVNCHGPANVEEFRYVWRLRGGLRFIAGLIFPTSGIGNLRTVFPAEGEHSISSELRITATGERGGFYVYQSQMDEEGRKTLMTYHGYSWGKRERKERTIFDYVKRLARIRKETPEWVEDSVKPLPPETMRDILTAIYYLRQNAPSIKEPFATTIYSDGKQYPVTFRPAEARSFVIAGREVNALGFEIADSPGAKRWPGGIHVWLSDDERRIPFRIQIQESMASLQLDLQSVEGCAFHHPLDGTGR